MRFDSSGIQMPVAKTMFDRYIGVDYSGASTPKKGLNGLRVFRAEDGRMPLEVTPSAGAQRHWSRIGIAEFLAAQLSSDEATLVGIDHGFSFPIAYFEQYGLRPDWHAFLVDFRVHWPCDEEFVSVQAIREGLVGNGIARQGNTRWRRLTELRSRRAKSVFHFDVQGSVAKSTHAGLPWLLYLRERLRKRVHFWPFDGWDIPEGHSVVVEAYPALCSSKYLTEGRDEHQHDAYSIARWTQEADRYGTLAGYFHPSITPEQEFAASIEGWILGVI